MEKRKANLFLVGAMKAGTTSLSEMLSQHSQVFLSPIKEPHYFVDNLPKHIYEPSRFFDLDTYFNENFPEPLHIAKISKQEHYEKLFAIAGSEHQYLADASTGYLHAPEAAEKIYNYNSNAKIIVLVRDPLKRAFSHYKMNLGMGRTKNSFSQEMKSDIETHKNGKLDNWSYLGMSLYSKNINRYLNKFGSNVLIVDLFALMANRDEEMKKITSFLNIEHENLEFIQSNASANLRFQKVLYIFKKLGLKDVFSHILPKKLRHGIFNKLSKKEALEIELDEATLKDLNALFKEDKSKLITAQ